MMPLAQLSLPLTVEAAAIEATRERLMVAQAGAGAAQVAWAEEPQLMVNPRMRVAFQKLKAWVTEMRLVGAVGRVAQPKVLAPMLNTGAVEVQAEGLTPP
jgi:hypothetical protein